MKLPLFVKGKVTNQVFVRGRTYTTNVYDFKEGKNKEIKFAEYYHFWSINSYINPITLEFKETELSIECLKQLKFLIILRILTTISSLFCFLSNRGKDEQIQQLLKQLKHQQTTFHSVPQPSIIKENFAKGINYDGKR